MGHYKGNISGRTVLRKYEKTKKGCVNCIWDISKSVILSVNIMDIAISATLTVMNLTLLPNKPNGGRLDGSHLISA